MIKIIGLFSNNNNWKYNEDTKKLIHPGDKVFLIGGADLDWQFHHSEELMSTGEYFKQQYSPFRDFGVEIGDFYILNPNDRVELIIDKLDRADLIILGGGSPYVLMKIIKALEIKYDVVDKLKRTRLIGISAGSMILGKHFYITPYVDENFDYYRVEDGLGLLNLAVMPHFDKTKWKHLKNKTWVRLHKDRDEKLVVLDDYGSMIVDRELK